LNIQNGGVQVALSQKPKFGETERFARAGGRMNSRVTIALEGSVSGETLRGEGYTVDISSKGCLVVVPVDFAIGEDLKLINLVNKTESAVKVVWRGHKGSAGWELGLELRNPPYDFWGLEF
jgi:hypothetical protein